MRIGLITDGIEHGSPGISRYAESLGRELAGLLPDQVLAIHRGPGAADFYSAVPSVRAWTAGLPSLDRQIFTWSQARALRLNVLHDTYHFPPFLAPAPYAKVMTVHDLTPLKLGTHSLRRRILHRLFVGRLARAADRVIAPSRSTARDVVELLGVREDRVSVVPEAADESFNPAPERVVEELRRRLGLPRTFYLCLGTLEPRKNIQRTMEAFSRATALCPDVELVVAGGKGWQMPEVADLARAMGIEDRVRVLGRVEEADLAALYSAALALVYPSLCEGFGLPPLEAMACGTPVIASNTSSLPEVVGEAGILVDPYDTDQIRGAMTELAGNCPLRAELSSRALRRARQFTWRRCAEETIDVYRRAISRS